MATLSRPKCSCAPLDAFLLSVALGLLIRGDAEL